nr:arginine--tRNA ligase, chloroplastic/mitochondrial [Tanacetum cinerariifolium]
MMYYILLKGAVDVDIALDVTSKVNPPDHKVYGYIHAFYRGEISYDCHCEAQDKYMALLFHSFLMVGPISLKRFVLSVPKNASLNIKAHLVDADTNEVILSDCYEFLQGRCNGTLHGLEDGASLDMKVI